LSENCQPDNNQRCTFAGMTNFIQRLLLSAFIISAAACSNNNEQTPARQNEMPAKEKELRDAVAQYPDSSVLKKTLIQYFEDNGNYDAALAELDKVIVKDTTDATLWDKKAQIWLLKDDTAKAISAYEKAINIFPDPSYVMSVGWLYAKTKNSKALEVADALLMADKAKAAKEALLIKGLYYSSTGDKQKALAAFDNCLALDYTFMLAYREKAIVLYETGRYEEAIKLLNKATTLQNNFDEGYYWLGQCYEKLKKTDAAIESYKTALMYNAEFAEAKDALGRLGAR
jgi:tetratricopeptide (TPR) repeat protein